MKYFTPQLYQALQDFRSDQAMDQAEVAWEKAAGRYRRHLQALRQRLPTGLRFLLENFYLHDADVFSMGQQGQTFLMVLRLGAPPREMLFLKYQLTEAAVINQEAMPPLGPGPVQWLYDEVGLTRGSQQVATHTILLSNGWEVQLQLRGLQVSRAQTLYPLPDTNLVPVPTAMVPQSA